MKRISFLLIFLLLFNITIISTVDKTDAKADTDYIQSKKSYTVDKNNLENTIKELTSSKYRGRLTASAGNELATKYMQERYGELNLASPLALDNYLQSYRQKVLNHGKMPLMHSLDQDGKVIGDYNYLTDFIQRTNWANCAISGDLKGELVLISSLADLTSKDIKDKVLLIKNELVDNFDNNTPQEADGLVRYILSLKKDIKAVIIQNDIRRNGYFHISTALSSKIRQLGYHNALTSEILRGKASGPMVFYCSDFAFETLEKAALAARQIRVKSEAELVEGDSSNIIAMIEGTSKKDQYIIIGAHLDHLGGYDNGPYYPGALDNASGIAAMLEIARIVKQLGPAKKTIVFSAFNGEEVYLAGSRFYVQQPIFPLSQSTMINLDMVGAKDCQQIDISGYYRKANQTQQKLARYASYLDINAKISRLASSDHVHFAANGVQSVMLTTREASPISHTINDNYQKAIDLDVVEELIELVVFYLQNQAY